MNKHSFEIKKWALQFLMLVLKEDKDISIFVTIAITILFWVLDSFYLSKERHYRFLYTSIVKGEQVQVLHLNVRESLTGKSSWLCTLFSTTQVLLYLFLIFLSLFLYSL